MRSISTAIQINGSCLHHVIVLIALLCFSMNLVHQMHVGQRSMCGVIVVDAGRSQSTNLGRDAYIHDHCFVYRHNYLLFYQLSNSKFFTHRLLFSREKPLVKPTAPGSSFSYICLAIYFICSFYSYLLNQKYKNTLLHFILFGVRSINIYNSLTSGCQFLAPLTERD